MSLRAWNGIPAARHAAVLALADREAALPAGSLLAHGNGRSYGDVCLNSGGTLLHTRWLDKLLAFDAERGIVRVEAGLKLAELLAWLLPRGWCLPVLPGTALATVGGAVANDVHGKNHASQGSFGHHVLRLELRGSGGERWTCSADEEPERFRATVGGLGLTGLITWVELGLLRVRDAGLVTRAQRFARLHEFWTLAGPVDQAAWPYQVAWFDCLHAEARGWLLEARHATEADPPTPAWAPRARRFPFMPPVSLVNAASLRAFNALYYHRPLPQGEQVAHALPYLFPLDGIADWYRLYGPRGFYQYQCVLPPPHEREALRELLQRIRRSGEGSFLAVLKRFGARAPAGLLSFPREGATLALDFPDRGARTLALFDELDAVVREAGGALYPAKDARMPPAMFRAGFPAWERFAAFVDPRFQSDFWRRVTQA
jgi:FAD/FMN-containing dehydrogenase